MNDRRKTIWPRQPIWVFQLQRRFNLMSQEYLVIAVSGSMVVLPRPRTAHATEGELGGNAPTPAHEDEEKAAQQRVAVN